MPRAQERHPAGAPLSSFTPAGRDPVVQSGGRKAGRPPNTRVFPDGRGCAPGRSIDSAGRTNLPTLPIAPTRR